jgi:hypothetical protein
MMGKVHSAAVAAHGPTNNIIITGGTTSLGAMLKTVQYTEDGMTFHSLPDMPEAKFVHQTAILDGGNIFVVGGKNELGEISKSCFLYVTRRRGRGAQIC